MSTRLGAGLRDTFSSLSTRNFRLFFIGQGISQVGNWMTLITQTLLVLKLTGSGVVVGLLSAAQFAPVLLLGAWAGLIADRSDKRRLLIIVQILAMMQSFALAALAFMDRPPVLGICAIAFLGGVTLAFDNPSRRAFVVELVDEERVSNAVSLNSAVMTTSRIIGPALAGLLIAGVGYGWVFLVDAVSYLAVLAGYAMMRKNELRTAAPAIRGRGQVREGLRYAHSTPELWVPLVIMAIIGTFTYNFGVVVPLLVHRTFHGTDLDFTTLFSVISVGALVGALAVARRTVITVRNVVRASGAFGLTMLVFAGAPTLTWAFPIALLVGVASIAFLTSTTTIVQLRAAPEMRGRVLALQAIVFLGSTPVGGPILGALSEWTNPRFGVLLGGVAALGAAAWGSMRCRRLDVHAGVSPAVGVGDDEVVPDAAAPYSQRDHALHAACPWAQRRIDATDERGS